MKKNKIKKGILLFILVTMILGQLGEIVKVNAFESGEYEMVYQLNSPYYIMLEDGTSVKLNQYAYYNTLTNCYISVYQNWYDEKSQVIRNQNTILRNDIDEEEIKKIIYAGYPYHSAQELGIYDTNAAYFATQLMILEYTQPEIFSQYQIPNDYTGGNIVTAMNQIRNNYAWGQEIKHKPEIWLSELSEWYEYEYDENYLVKEVQIEKSDEDYHFFTIEIPNNDGSIKILNGSTNYEENAFYTQAMWKILVRKESMENWKEGIGLNLIGNMQTDEIWKATSTENGKEYLLYQERIENIVYPVVVYLPSQEEDEPPTDVIPPDDFGGEEQGEEQVQEDGNDLENQEPSKEEEKQEQVGIANENINTNTNENNFQNIQENFQNLHFAQFQNWMIQVSPNLSIENKIEAGKEELVIEKQEEKEMLKEQENKESVSKESPKTEAIFTPLITNLKTAYTTKSNVTSKTLPRTGF